MNEDILRMAGQPPIEIELRKRCLQWFGHVQRMGCEGTQKRVLDVDQLGRKDNLGGGGGGVSLRWVDTISRDLSWTQLEDWTDVVTDRQEWRGINNQLCWPDTRGIID